MKFTRQQISSLAAHVRTGKSLATHDIGHRLADVLDEHVEILEALEHENELAKPPMPDDAWIQKMNEALS